MVLRFDWTEEDRDGYEGMLNYLVRKCRCGVIDEHLPEVKDFYLVPLMVDQEVPHQLLPFSGPGIVYNTLPTTGKKLKHHQSNKLSRL